jgi:hypothetical protein
MSDYAVRMKDPSLAPVTRLAVCAVLSDSSPIFALRGCATTEFVVLSIFIGDPKMDDMCGYDQAYSFRAGA